MKRIFIFLLLGVFVISQTVYGNGGMAFLKIGAGARATAMGEAYTAVANDATGLYWNPAGIIKAPMREVIFTHNEWLNDVSHDFLGLVFPRKSSAIGLSMILNNIEGLERRVIASESPLAEFSAHDLWAGISYAHSFGSRINIGLTAKYLYEKIYLETASGFAVDFGAQYQPNISSLILAAAMQNMGSTSALRQQKIKLPLTFRMGLAWCLPNLSSGNILLALDVVHVQTEKTHLNAGAEYSWQQRIALRAGYQTGFAAKSISAGFGLNLGFFKLNYAFVPFDADFDHTHRFELGVKF